MCIRDRSEYRFTNRGGKGVKTINVTEKTGALVGILDVTEKEDLMISSRNGITIRMSVAQISEQGRATQGVKLIRVDEGDEIAAITKIAEEEEEQNGTAAAAEVPSPQSGNDAPATDDEPVENNQ